MKINPFRALVEIFRPHEDVSPLKSLPINHPHRQYSYTLVGHNNKPLTTTSLLGLGFIGRIRNSTDFITSDNELLFRDLNTCVEIAMFYNVPKLRKYHDTGHGIEWESSSRDVYLKLVEAKLFPQ